MTIYRPKTKPPPPGDVDAAPEFSRVELRPAAPQILLELSRDGGRTWITLPYKDLGAVGEYAKRVRWNRLGSGRDIVLRFSVTDTLPVTVLDLQVQT